MKDLNAYWETFKFYWLSMKNVYQYMSPKQEILNGIRIRTKKFLTFLFFDQEHYGFLGIHGPSVGKSCSLRTKTDDDACLQFFFRVHDCGLANLAWMATPSPKWSSPEWKEKILKLDIWLQHKRIHIERVLPQPQVHAGIMDSAHGKWSVGIQRLHYLPYRSSIDALRYWRWFTPSCRKLKQM